MLLAYPMIVENILPCEIGLTKVSRWVLLTSNQKRTSIVTSRDNLTMFGADPVVFLERFQPQDECWGHHFDPETKRKCMQYAPRHLVQRRPSFICRESGGLNILCGAKKHWVY